MNGPLTVISERMMSNAENRSRGSGSTIKCLWESRLRCTTDYGRSRSSTGSPLSSVSHHLTPCPTAEPCGRALVRPKARAALSEVTKVTYTGTHDPPVNDMVTPNRPSSRRPFLSAVPATCTIDSLAGSNAARNFSEADGVRRVGNKAASPACDSASSGGPTDSETPTSVASSVSASPGGAKSTSRGRQPTARQVDPMDAAHFLVGREPWLLDVRGATETASVLRRKSCASRSSSASLLLAHGGHPERRRTRQGDGGARHKHTLSAQGAASSDGGGAAVQAVARPLFQRYLLRELGPDATQPVLTVVFDLDETLVFNRRLDSGVGPIFRPFVFHVLNALHHFKGLEIVLWTASTKETAEPVVRQLCDGGATFADVIYRNDAWFTEQVHTKDLRLLGRDMRRLLIVDNAPNCCKLNPGSAILIDDFYGICDEQDAALVNVYYIIERTLENCGRGGSVRQTLQSLARDGLLCHNVEYELPETWKRLPLEEIAPLKVPPFGTFVRANTPPPSSSIMQHWTM